ncbi:hypothetical protein NSQ95_11370 [Psychrobacillus sp. FSL W7-1457]|uniref:hypothetical protein n=1 Tax=unclassified Psychrobacillus TaxID=2636677 RepID=UPI0030F6D922
MTETKNQEEPKKKMTLQEAVKQKLEEKKNQAGGGNLKGAGPAANQKMKSQQTKKVSNTRRKMGV